MEFEAPLEADALGRLRDFLAGAALGDDGRLPPERELADRLGLTRASLRRALTTLQSEGAVWRHVGKGTFAGNRPIDTASDVASMARRTNPIEIMNARISIEPEIARVAALNATPTAIAELQQCMTRAVNAPDWRQYENWDNRLHRAIAEATQNSLLLGLLDTLNAVRREVNWGRLRADPRRPPANHHSFTEHEQIVAAIANRDTAGAAAAMRAHLQSVERHLRNS